MVVPARSSTGDPVGRVVAGLGRADGDRHRLRGGADRHAGPRVPVELRIFLTAAAIVDDLGAILAVALFYSGDLNLLYLWPPPSGRRSGDAEPLAHLSLAPYVAMGVVLMVLRAGERPACHPGRRHPRAVHSDPASAEPDRAHHPGERHLRRRSGARWRSAAAWPFAPALRALDAIHDRLESPADRLLRNAGARSSYPVLPLSRSPMPASRSGSTLQRERAADGRDHLRAGHRQAAGLPGGVGAAVIPGSR